ncbi:MAG: ABC transporter substrate-binding protein [Bradyrhizobium sp.]|nr:MAG: ABC transporter substrate-binding protein [Bradyrhizobium sp.]
MNRRQMLLGVAAATLSPRLAAAQAARPLKIGVMNDMTSVYADYQGVGSVIAAKLAVDDYSAALGVPVEIISADHQNKPDIGAGIARRWFDEGSVDVVMDLPNSAVALAVLAIATEKNKAVIGSGAGSSVMTGPKCSRNFVHWTYDTYALGTSIGKALTEQGGKSWFFITADYAFGKDLEANCAAAVEAAGGKVLGSARHPLNAADFSSFLLQAQASGADVVGLANAGGDLNNTIKAAHEFGIAEKQRLAGLILNVTNIPSLGLEAVQNATICTPFYWDFNDGTRAFAARFQAAHPSKMKPNDMHAGMYAATAHLMKAMAQVGGADDGVKLIDAMKAIPTDDPLFGKGSIRIDGRKLHPLYLLATKTLAESKGDWDYFKLVSTIKPEDAWRPLDKGGCPFIKA